MFNSQALRQMLQKMPPGRKRWLAIGGLVTVIVGCATWFETKTNSSTVAVDRAKVVSEVLLDGDTRNLTIDGLAGQIDKLEDEYKDLSDKVTQTQANTAAGILAIQGKLDQTPSAAAGTDPVARSEIEALDKRVAASGSGDGTGGQSATAAPLTIGSVYGPQAPVPAPAAGGDGTTGTAAAPDDATVTMHYFTGKDTDLPSVPAKPVLQEYEIPAGSILSGTLVTGLDAPTSDASRRDPIPLLLRIKDLAILPSVSFCCRPMGT
jgi:conjugal transfer pilus assembly protein TraB